MGNRVIAILAVVGSLAVATNAQQTITFKAARFPFRLWLQTRQPTHTSGRLGELAHLIDRNKGVCYIAAHERVGGPTLLFYNTLPTRKAFPDEDKEVPA